MSRAVLYARYSTDKQSSASVEDQFRLLRQRAEHEGWAIVGEHADRAISGTVRDRPGLNACMAAIASGGADLLLAESIDRISRDQEDQANIYKHVRVARAQIVTLSEGRIGAIHIGMSGTMAALYIEQLGEKVRRGQIGVVADGRAPGGMSYGYRAVRKFGDDGEPIRGLREVDPEQAAIVLRIFTEYADGKGPVAIAKQLNAEGILSPRRGLWRANTISRKRRNGILNNELYRGRILYNRQSFMKDPDTRKRVSRPNAQGELVEKDVPALRIVPEDLWQRVHDRMGLYIGKRPEAARRPKRLLSGLLRCGQCGGSYIIVSTDRWGCSNRKQSGTCANGVTITNGSAEARILSALKRDLLHPDVVAAYLEELRVAAADARRQLIRAGASRDRRIAELGAEEARIADAVAKGMPPEPYIARAKAIAAERSQLEAERDSLPDFERLVAHPSMPDQYRRRIEKLHELINTSEALRTHGRAVLEELVDHIDVTPRANDRRGANLILHGDLAAILQLDTKKPAQGKSPAGECTPTMVAGVGFEPTTFRL